MTREEKRHITAVSQNGEKCGKITFSSARNFILMENMQLRSSHFV